MGKVYDDVMLDSRGQFADSDLDRDRAGFWRRFVASFIDGLVVGIVALVIGRVVPYGFWISIAGEAGYYCYFHGRTGQTPGDAALGIRVVDLSGGTGEPIGYARALARWFVSYFSGAVLLLGYLWMLWDNEKQTWHDKAAGSVVVRIGS